MQIVWRLTADKLSIFLLSRDREYHIATDWACEYLQYTETHGRWEPKQTLHIQNVAYFSGWLYPGTEHTDSKDTTDFHLYQAALDDQDNGNVWLDQNKVLSNGNGAVQITEQNPKARPDWIGWV